jgi:hypothetical protein
MFETFFTAYLVCALWSSTDGETHLNSNYNLSDFAPETLAALKEKAKGFYDENFNLIKDNIEGAGHDLWLTQNHHGAGFFDGDWPNEIGEKLTVAAHKVGQIDLYVGDDGQIWA